MLTNNNYYHCLKISKYWYNKNKMYDLPNIETTGTGL